FSQLIDHGQRSLGTFSQRYITNEYYYRQGGPIILYINGEDELNYWAIEGQVADLAQATGGLLVALEHRYFGQSLPFSEFTTKNMQYLTTDQALKDLARFIQSFKGTSKAQINPSSRWIVVGGSYAGNLAAWMRLTYPDLVFAAYSSSAPVKAKLDFFEYDMAVHDGLPSVCASALSNATIHMDTILMSNTIASQKAKETLKARFGLEAVKDDVSFA
ncbi:peptidase S28, partial [Piptocephalis cylindrospora]